jgi:hypothetical protein
MQRTTDFLLLLSIRLALDFLFEQIAPGSLGSALVETLVKVVDLPVGVHLVYYPLTGYKLVRRAACTIDTRRYYRREYVNTITWCRSFCYNWTTMCVAEGLRRLRTILCQ